MPPKLTGRQSQVARLTAEGKTAPQIAQVMGIAAHTVQKHRKEIYKRLGVHGVSAIADLARIDPEALNGTDDTYHNTPKSRWHWIVDENGCWTWQGAQNGKGYGQKNVPYMKRNEMAHRWYFMFFKHPIPDGMTIDHLCFNKLCVNPKHLECVTIQENIRRAAQRRAGILYFLPELRKRLRRRKERKAARKRKRTLKPGHAYLRPIGPHPRPVGNPSLTEDQVKAIRKEYRRGRGGGYKRVAIKYGVTPLCIRDIVLRRTWRHI